MSYWDTSALAKLYTAEVDSPALADTAEGFTMSFNRQRLAATFGA